LFLSTDASISSEKMFQVYVLRWSIEVFFKEAKQHLGFLLRTNPYLCFPYRLYSFFCDTLSYVGRRQTAINGTSIGQIRLQVQDQFDSLNYAARLWSVFRSLIAGTLKTMHKQLNCKVDDIMEKLDERVSRFLVQALQLDAFTMQHEHESRI